MTDSDEVKLLPSNSAEFCCVRKTGDYVLMAVTPKGEETLRYWLSLGGAEVLAAEINGALSTRPPVVTDEVVERVARAIGEAERASCGGYLSTTDTDPKWNPWLTDKHRMLARAALASMPAVVSGGQSNE